MPLPIDRLHIAHVQSLLRDYSQLLFYNSIRNKLKLVLQCLKGDRKIISDCHQGSIIYSMQESNELGQTTSPLGAIAQQAH